MITTTYISHNHSMPEHITELYLSEHTCRGVVRSVGGFPFSGFLRAPLARLEACKTDFSLSHSPLQLMWIMLYGFFTRRCLSEQLLWNGSQHVDSSESFLASKLYSCLPLVLRLFFLLVILPSWAFRAQTTTPEKDIQLVYEFEKELNNSTMFRQSEASILAHVCVFLYPHHIWRFFIVRAMKTLLYVAQKESSVP